MIFKNSLFNMAAVVASIICPANAMAASMFTANLTTLNADFGSTASGSATITLDEPSANMRTLRLQIEATGLQDLTDIPGAIHVGHIHGQFAGNAERSLAQQGDGAFFDGMGGIVANSVLPTLADADINVDEVDQGLSDDLYLDFFEGRPSYGPVVLNLTSQQLESAPEGLPPLSFFFQQAGAGAIAPAALFPSGTEFNLDTTYTFDLTDPDQARQYNNLTPLNQREIVLHGLTIPTAISDAIDTATNTAPGSPTAGIPLGNNLSFRSTAPVAAGTIEAVEAESVPEPMAMSLTSLALLALTLGTLRRRARIYLQTKS